MRAIALLLTLALSLSAQVAGIRVVLRDGTMIDQIGFGVQKLGPLEVRVVKIPDGGVRVGVGNRGMPEALAASWQIGDRVWIREIYAGAPRGWKADWGAEKEVRPPLFAYLGMDVHPVLDTGHRHPIIERIPESKDCHLLEGGATWWWDFHDRAVGDVKPPPPVQRELLPLLRVDPDYDPALNPRVETLRSFYRWSPTSGVWASRYPHDMGWRMRWYAPRFAAKSTLGPDGVPLARLPATTGPHDWGSMVWADGHSNWHYDGPRWALEAHALGHAGAWDLALLAVTHKVQHGFVWTDAVDPGVSNTWRYEKSSQSGEGSASDVPIGGSRGHPGDDNPPRTSHMWDLGSLAVARMSGDPDLLEAMRRRGEEVLKTRPNVTHYGPRSWAWNAENLLAFWKLTGDVRFKARLEIEVDRLFADRPAGPCFAWPDDPGTGEWSPWQTLVALAIVEQAREDGAKVQPHRVTEMVAIRSRTIAEGTRLLVIQGNSYLQACMVKDRSPWQGAPNPDIWQGPGLTPLVLPSLWYAARLDPARFAETWQAAALTTREVFVGSWTGVGKPLPLSEVSADCSGWGGGGDKIAADFMWGGRPRYLVAPSTGQ